MYRRFSIVLAVGLLAGLLVAFTPGDAPYAKAALGPVQGVTLTGADFHPADDGVSFHSNGNYVRSDGVLTARIPFPAEVVVITSVKARVYDDQSPGDLCVDLYRARPGDGYEDFWGMACTSGTSTVNPQTLSITVFGRVGRFHTAYLWVPFTGTSNLNLKLYGATVFYRVVS